MKLVRRILAPIASLRRIGMFYKECFLDSRAYLRSATVCGFSKTHKSVQLESAVVRLSHVLEKGLCMPEFKPRSGTELLKSLLRILDDPKVTSLVSEYQLRAARAVICSYKSRHLELGIDVSDLFDGHRLVVCPATDESMGGATAHRPASPAEGAALLRVMATRASVRDFDMIRIPDRKCLDDCILAAIRSPSVCNRQTWRVHAYDGGKVQKILSLQNGNRGFGHAIPIVLAITSDMRQFSGSDERYQPWIEGGIFSMALLLALHANGIGAVSLNWSVLNATDKKLRMAGNIPDHERIVVLVGCGFPSERAAVPVSYRRSVEEILTWH